jgi:hypothetical protein
MKRPPRREVSGLHSKFVTPQVHYILSLRTCLFQLDNTEVSQLRQECLSTRYNNIRN